MIYYSLFTFIAILSILERFDVTKFDINKSYFRIIVAIVFLLGTIRWQRGSDWSSYYNYFQDPWNSWDTHFEIGYAILNRIVRSITDNYTLFLLLENIIQFSLFILVIDYISNRYKILGSFYLAILLYEYSQGFAGMFCTRSQIAKLICMLALCYLLENKIFHFIILVIMASLFHNVSITFLIVIPIYMIRDNLLRFNMVLCAITLIFLIRPSFVISLMSLIPAFSRYATSYISTEFSGVSYIGVFQWTVFLFAMYYLRIRYGKTDDCYNLVIMLYSIGYSMYIWSSLYSSVFSRVAGLYLSVIIFAIPVILGSLSKNESVLVFELYLLYCFVSFFSLLYGPYSVLYLPYHTIFDNVVVVSDL